MFHIKITKKSAVIREIKGGDLQEDHFSNCFKVPSASNPQWSVYVFKADCFPTEEEARAEAERRIVQQIDAAEKRLGDARVRLLHFRTKGPLIKRRD